MESLQRRLAKAMCADDSFAALSGVVRTLAEQGTPREALYEELERLRSALRHHGRDDQDDIILDVMDLLTGFCAPHARI
jgi:hypothetical protein